MRGRGTFIKERSAPGTLLLAAAALQDIPDCGSDVVVKRRLPTTFFGLVHRVFTSDMRCPIACCAAGSVG